jgi:hypothetical protein
MFAELEKRYGVSRPSFERCLHMPQRTTQVWVPGKTPVEGILLLRIILTYPWMLDAAADGYPLDNPPRNP